MVDEVFPFYKILMSLLYFVRLGKDILTGTVQLVPPKISEVVDLYLSANIATKIPQDGSIEYIFPTGSTAPY